MTRSRVEFTDSPPSTKLSLGQPEQQLRLTLKATGSASAPATAPAAAAAEKQKEDNTNKDKVNPRPSSKKLGFLHRKFASMGNSNGKQVDQNEDVRLSHFKLLRVVGKGAFGKVRIVEQKSTNRTYALKYIRKDEVVRSENVRNIVRERRMLEHLNHQFLCNLRYSFQDYEYLYLVSDLMTGGDLRFHITRKTFTEDCIRFWMAQLACALRYVHGQGIIHRDVKPDNILLDSEGHVHLTDFNVASDFQPGKPLTSKSGTLAYLAPEVYEGKGYSCEVDWWSLGVVFYECIYSRRPFESSSHEGLANKIKAAQPAYPFTSPPVTTQCSSAIKSLVEKNVHDRIGANGFDNFTQHPFFLQYDFYALEARQIAPIFRPSSDKTNFDATYDLEELLLEEAPLEARAKHQKPRPQLKANATPQEKRMAGLYQSLEKLFTPFDFEKASFDKISEGAANPAVPGEIELPPPIDTTGTVPKKSRRAGAPTDTTQNSQSTSIAAPGRTSAAVTSNSSSSGSLNKVTAAPAPTSVPTVINGANAVKSPDDLPDFPEELLRSQPKLSKQPSPNVQPIIRPRAARSISAGHAQSASASATVTVPASRFPQTQDPKSQAYVKPTIRTASSADPPSTKRGGIRGFLSKGRNRALSPRRIENGIIGKEGARVVQSWN